MLRQMSVNEIDELIQYVKFYRVPPEAEHKALSEEDSVAWRPFKLLEFSRVRSPMSFGLPHRSNTQITTLIGYQNVILYLAAPALPYNCLHGCLSTGYTVRRYSAITY